MGRVILQEFVSLDGLASGPDGDVSFVPAATAGDQSFGQRQMGFIDSVGAMLLGRVTYQMFAAHWPNVTSGDDKPFADKINALQKYVFSRTLDRAPWGRLGDATIFGANAAKAVAKLKQESSKDMVIWGSLSLAESFARDRLIDEYQVIVCPVVLGNGTPLFPRNPGSFSLKLLDTKSFDRGTVLLSYATAS